MTRPNVQTRACRARVMKEPANMKEWEETLERLPDEKSTSFEAKGPRGRVDGEVLPPNHFIAKVSAGLGNFLCSQAIDRAAERKAKKSKKRSSELRKRRRTDHSPETSIMDRSTIAKFTATHPANQRLMRACEFLSNLVYPKVFYLSGTFSGIAGATSRAVNKLDRDARHERQWPCRARRPHISRGPRPNDGRVQEEADRRVHRG